MKMIKTLIYISLFLANTCTLLAQSSDSLRVVIAEKGDGIYKILRDNEYPAKDYYNLFKELNIDKIGDDDSLTKGETYFLPNFITKDTVSAPDLLTDTISNDSIINPNKTDTDSIIDMQLDGAIFYLISGHGGPDPGAVTQVDGINISEDEYAYDITLRIARKIKEHSGMIYMITNDPNDGIREDELLDIDYDEYCYPDLEIPRSQNQRLIQRSNAVNDIYQAGTKTGYHRVIVIHLDSRSTGDNVDVFFYHYPGSKKGEKLAKTLQQKFADKYAEYQPNRGYEGTVTGRNLLVIRKVLPPAIFIELGNIQNEHDRKRFFNPDNRQALAKWIVEGLIDDFNANQ
jgi:N-acetylmuramoyl-L-alanine amidase